MSFDLSTVRGAIQHLGNGFLTMLPRMVMAVVVVLLAFLIARAARALIRHAANRRGRQRTLELAIGRLVQAGILIVGVLIAATVAFPSFTPADLVSALGIGGIAIGFAFKDIFQNFLAGILILITKPFRVGDQIIFGSYEGTVEDIQTRATYLKTYDGRRVIIPNGDLYTSSITVNTAFPQRRMEYDIGIGYGDDVERARAIVLDALRDAEGVSPDPKADVIVTNLAESSVSLRARWWCESRMADTLIAQDKVLSLVKRRLADAGIDLPFPTRQILFHDQTETTDGDRRRQREGWPAGEGEVPGSASIARAVVQTAGAVRTDANGRAGSAGSAGSDHATIPSPAR